MYRRVLVKLSGEALAGTKGFGIEPSVVDRLTDEVKQVHETGVSLGLVIGGGNIVRGSLASQKGMDRVQADYMGMLATIINALAIQDLLERKEVATRVHFYEVYKDEAALAWHREQNYFIEYINFINAMGDKVTRSHDQFTIIDA